MRSLKELAAAVQKEKTAGKTTNMLNQILKRLPSQPSAKPSMSMRKGLTGLGKYLLGGLVVSGGLAAGNAAFDSADRAWTRRKGFQNMLKSNPDLAGKEDELKPLFRTMTHFSPQVAKDPLASGSMIRRMHDFREVGIPLQDIASLAKIQKDTAVQKPPGGNKGVDKVLQDLFLQGKD